MCRRRVSDRTTRRFRSKAQFAATKRNPQAIMLDASTILAAQFGPASPRKKPPPLTHVVTPDASGSKRKCDFPLPALSLPPPARAAKRLPVGWSLGSPAPRCAECGDDPCLNQHHACSLSAPRREYTFDVLRHRRGRDADIPRRRVAARRRPFGPILAASDTASVALVVLTLDLGEATSVRA